MSAGFVLSGYGLRYCCSCCSIFISPFCLALCISISSGSLFSLSSIIMSLSSHFESMALPSLRKIDGMSTSRLYLIISLFTGFTGVVFIYVLSMLLTTV